MCIHNGIHFLESLTAHYISSHFAHLNSCLKHVVVEITRTFRNGDATSVISTESPTFYVRLLSQKKLMYPQLSTVIRVCGIVNADKVQ